MYIAVQNRGVPPENPRHHLVLRRWLPPSKAAQGAIPGPQSFRHGDYQHFNILWRRDVSPPSSTGSTRPPAPPISTWGTAGTNLAVLFSPGRSEEFRRVDESEAGRKVDPSWDLAAMLSFDQGWHEDLLPAAVARL